MNYRDEIVIIFAGNGDLGKDPRAVGMNDGQIGRPLFFHGDRVTRGNAGAEKEDGGRSGEEVSGEEEEKKSDAIFHAPDLSD